jgi:hypothetical protein
VVPRPISKLRQRLPLNEVEVVLQLLRRRPQLLPLLLPLRRQQLLLSKT